MALPQQRMVYGNRQFNLPWVSRDMENIGFYTRRCFQTFRRFISPATFSVKHPVFAPVDRDAEAGFETALMVPLNIRLPGMLHFLEGLVGTETAVHPARGHVHVQMRGKIGEVVRHLLLLMGTKQQAEE
uniref:Uncharacterized protein n=1 Tax=Polytomella parva TaxID=51329 RepID=A0A7S0UK53_9CHLO